MKTIAAVKYAFGGVGALMLVGALYWALHTRSFIAQASLAGGTVIDLVAVSSTSGSLTYKPVVRFVAADGPEDAAINGFLALWLGGASPRSGRTRRAARSTFFAARTSGSIRASI